MTQTAKQAKKDFQDILNMSGAQTREKLMTVQSYLNDATADFSTTNGSKVYTTMSKFAKGPLEKLLAGQKLSADEHAKIHAAARAGSENRLTKYTFYKALKSIKAEEAITAEIQYNANKQERRDAVTQARTNRLEQSIPLMHELRMESTIAGQRLPSGVREHATLMYVEAQKNPEKIPDFVAFARDIIDQNSPIWDQERKEQSEQTLSAPAAVTQPAVKIFSKPGKINRPMPIIVAANDSDAGIKKRFGLFSALRSPDNIAQLVRRTAAAAAVLIFGATMLGNGNHTDETNIAFNDAPAVSTMEISPSIAASMGATTEIAPVIHSAIGIPFTAPAVDTLDVTISAITSIAGSLTAPEALTMPEATLSANLLQTPTTTSVTENIDLGALSFTPVSFTPVEEIAALRSTPRIDFDVSAVPTQTPLNPVPFDVNAADDTPTEIRFDIGAVNFDERAAPEQTAMNNTASIGTFETGLSTLFNGNVPDALAKHSNEIGNGLNSVDDAIFAYRVLRDLPKHVKGSAAHEFAMNNLGMIADGNFGSVSELARDAVQSSAWMAQRYNVQDGQRSTATALANNSRTQTHTNG